MEESDMGNAFHSFLERNGWSVLIALLMAAYFYYTYVRPLLKARKESEEARRRKIFGKLKKKTHQQSRRASCKKVEEKYNAGVEAARRRMQEEITKETEERRRRQREELKAKFEKEDEEERIAANASSTTTGLRRRKEDEKNKGEDPVAYVKRIAASRKVVVFSKSWCAFSRRAKHALSSFRLGADKLLLVELDDLGDKEWVDSVQSALEQLTGVRRTPRVFINGECIGGEEETVQACRSGLMEMLLGDER